MPSSQDDCGTEGSTAMTEFTLTPQVMDSFRGASEELSCHRSP